MIRTIMVLSAAALFLPVSGAAAQDAWWAPVADRIQSDEGVDAICRMRPSMPVCDDRRTADRSPDARDRDRNPRTSDRRTADRRDSRRAGDAGPPFCRNGQGHPVHGMRWCRDKGFGGGGAVWRDVSWGDVILGPRAPRRAGSTLDRGGLIDILGDVVVGRLESHSGARGGGALTGRIVGDDIRILQIRNGNRPVAELLDVDGDGRIDRVLLHDGR